MSGKELLRTLKFLLFSLSAGIIELAAFTLLTELTHWSYWPSYLIALILSVVWDFTSTAALPSNLREMFLSPWPRCWLFIVCLHRFPPSWETIWRKRSCGTSIW